jgi:lysophospholipase L1-like esterase
MVIKMRKKLFLILFIVSICFNLYVFLIECISTNFDCLNKILSDSKEDKILDLNIYKDLTEEYFFFNKEYEKSKIVFIGDSITKRFNINEFTGECEIINRGIFYDTTLGLLNRIDSNLNFLKISKVFIMIGYNDLKIRTNNEIISNIKKIVTEIKAEKVYLQSLLPVSFERKELNNRIVFINSEIKKIADNQKVFFIDLYSHFKSNKNYINPRLTRDGIHPNYYGNKLWFSVIEEYL